VVYTSFDVDKATQKTYTYFSPVICTVKVRLNNISKEQHQKHKVVDYFKDRVIHSIISIT